MSYINSLPKAELLVAGKVSPKILKAGEGLATHTDSVDEYAIAAIGAITVTIDGVDSHVLLIEA